MKYLKCKTPPKPSLFIFFWDSAPVNPLLELFIPTWYDSNDDINNTILILDDDVGFLGHLAVTQKPFKHNTDTLSPY